MPGPGGRAHVGAGRRLLRAISRTGAAMCVSAAVVGLVLMVVADQAGVINETLTGRLGFALFIFGVVAPFGFWSVHLAVEQWVDAAGEFFGGQFSRPVTVAGSGAFGLLALGLFTFAFFPVLAFAPDEGARLGGAFGVLMGGSILLAVLVSAIAGGIALFGWLGAVVGTLTGTGFILLVCGRLLSEAPLVAPIGLVLLVLGTGGFLGLREMARSAGGDITARPAPR